MVSDGTRRGNRSASVTSATSTCGRDAAGSGAGVVVVGAVVVVVGVRSWTKPMTWARVG